MPQTNFPLLKNPEMGQNETRTQRADWNHVSNVPGVGEMLKMDRVSIAAIRQRKLGLRKELRSGIGEKNNHNRVSKRIPCCCCKPSSVPESTLPLTASAATIE